MNAIFDRIQTNYSLKQTLFYETKVHTLKKQSSEI